MRGCVPVRERFHARLADQWEYHMSRFVLSLAIVFSTALTLAFAVEATPAKATATESLTIWWAQWAPADGLQQIADTYAKETGTKITVHQIPWGSFQDQVFLNFGNATTSFDIVVGDSQWLGRGATRGLYVDLTSWLPGAIDLAGIKPQALSNLCEYPSGSKHYFAAPCETDAVGLAYRADWFTDPAEQAAFLARFHRPLAVPKTWTEFAQVAEFFHRPTQNRYGNAQLTGRGYDAMAMGFQQILWSYGGSWGDAATYAVHGHLDTPEAVKGLEFFRTLTTFGPKGATNLDYGQVLDVFTNGSTAMSCTYFAFFPTIAKQLGPKAGFAVMPANGERHAISLGGQGFSVSAKIPVPRQEAAKKFIAWFNTPAVQRQWITKEAGFTANTAILASPEFRAASPYNAAFADSLDHVRDFWNVPVYNELLASAVKHLGEALDGADAQASLRAIADEHEAIFEDAGLKK